MKGWRHTLAVQQQALEICVYAMIELLHERNDLRMTLASKEAEVAHYDPQAAQKRQAAQEDQQRQRALRVSQLMAELEIHEKLATYLVERESAVAAALGRLALDTQHTLIVGSGG